MKTLRTSFFSLLIAIFLFGCSPQIISLIADILSIVSFVESQSGRPVAKLVERPADLKYTEEPIKIIPGEEGRAEIDEHGGAKFTYFSPSSEQNKLIIFNYYGLIPKVSITENNTNIVDYHGYFSKDGSLVIPFEAVAEREYLMKIYDAFAREGGFEYALL